MTWTHTPHETALLDHAIANYGAMIQQIKAAEEYAEASAAISRFMVGGADLMDLAEELADAEIMQAQLYLMTDGLADLVSERRAVKLAALAMRSGFGQETV